MEPKRIREGYLVKKVSREVTYKAGLREGLTGD
jgi:hypothetical protein